MGAFKIRGDNMSEFIDLDDLIPEIKGFKFKDSEGNEHKIKMFIPVGVSLLQEKYKDDLDELQIRTITSICEHQFDFMDREWVNDNISLEIMNTMYIMVLEYNRETQDNYVTVKAGGKVKKKNGSGKFWQR